ncbi:MAG: glycosyltransferase [Candidatus Pacebacteria bacterium]|jgi:glycosyltransferase involved in cell wall biosynthesis|nr:glycosyl transferase [Parcubacteria group bacterium]MDP7367621.1 glycosyltransferase [Candidatus Paceibacterota bacterium]MDP7466488.1 glycosyltransferase [Candidatus Paceibacterota bacterium]MDP7648530.1 glycosyltransferase [Candidatus Paceibacterota bacterium]HJO90014.1 glycosyltransferase [Candidatus Paceibacterota bacterium]|tara:strand:+ start:3990 stop:5273 length:1284 start_codon:yes stop_codon:yes gene_type:complete
MFNNNNRIEINDKNIKKADLVVGIPSYKEAGNIAFVAEQASLGLKKYFPKYKSVIINVDNNSLDGTKEAFLGARTKVPKIYISTPPKTTGKGNNFYNLLNEIRALNGKAVVVIDADIKSVTPEWIQSFLNPILEKKYDFITPMYTRHEYDGTITNNVCYPMVASFLGINIRQPIGGDFAFSRKLSDHLLEQKWSPGVLHYGIDIFMTLHTIIGEFKMCQVGLGEKVHKPSAPKLGPMFTQVIETAFDILLSNKEKWVIESRLKDLPIYGKDKVDKPQDLPISYKGMKEASLYEFSINKEVLRRALSSKIYRRLEHMYDKENIKINADLWSKIIYDIFYAYDTTDMGPELVEALKSLYFGRSLTFIKDTMDMTYKQSEEEIKKQVEIFVKNKNYLLVKYKIAPSVIDTIVQRIPILKNNTKTRRLTTH